MPAGNITILSFANEKIPTFGSPKISERMIGTIHFPSPGNTITLPSLSLTARILIFLGGLLIPLFHRRLFVSSLNETLSVFILLAAYCLTYLTALGVRFSLGAVQMRLRLRS